VPGICHGQRDLCGVGVGPCIASDAGRGFLCRERCRRDQGQIALEIDVHETIEEPRILLDSSAEEPLVQADGRERSSERDDQVRIVGQERPHHDRVTVHQRPARGERGAQRGAHGCLWEENRSDWGFASLDADAARSGASIA
jgi:hypothetical protein